MSKLWKDCFESESVVSLCYKFKLSQFYDLNYVSMSSKLNLKVNYIFKMEVWCLSEIPNPKKDFMQLYNQSTPK